MPDFIAQAGEWWPARGHDGGDGCVYEYDPRTPRQRHDDHFKGLVANYPNGERWVVLDERQLSVSIVHPGKRYEIVRVHGSVSNCNEDGTPRAMSLTRAEYGAPWVREYVLVKFLHRTPEAAAEFLRSMHASAVADMEDRISSLRSDINALNSAVQEALRITAQGAQGVEGK